MKYSVFTIILLCVVAGISFSCKKESSAIADNDIAFDSIHSVKNYHLNNDSTQPSCNLKMTFIYPKSCSDAFSLDSLQHIFLTSFFDESYSHLKPSDAVAAYEKAYVDNYIQDVNIYIKDREQSSHDDAPAYLSYYETIDNEIKFNKANILAFQVVLTTYKGGSTSYEFLKNKVVNLETGQLISEEDIFNPGFEKLLSQIFKNHLLKANKVQTVNELENIGYFGIDEMIPNDNFLLDNKGVTYIFNKGENSVLQLDAIKIFIPYEDLTLVLKEKSPIKPFLPE